MENKGKNILAIDVGAGTQDILLYNPSEPLENSVKLVLPSPTIIMARRIGLLTSLKKNIFLRGQLMGGGPVVRAIRSHIEAGLKVFSLLEPAKTIHDNINRIEKMGVIIVKEKPEADLHDNIDIIDIILGDIDEKALRKALAYFEVKLPETLAIALQDHGFSPGSSNRIARFKMWTDFLNSGGEIWKLLYQDPPENLTRLKAASSLWPGAFLMDTGAAALMGIMLDRAAHQEKEKGIVSLNVGNGHTVAALVKGSRVHGIYEHHTHFLDQATLSDQIKRFKVGELENSEVFEQNGHGVSYGPDYQKGTVFDSVFVTGPRWALAQGIGQQATPMGDMMLSGCFGLIEAVRKKEGLSGIYE